jgi:short-subunit dehydrogenase
MNVVITGASKGLGKAMAEAFAAKGHPLFICARNEKQLQATVEALLATYPTVTIKATQKDLSSKQAAQDFGQWVLQQGIVPDVLINNAGQFQFGSIHQETEDVLEYLMRVNVYSAYHLTRSLLPPMMQKQSGHIINICSIAALQGKEQGGAYSISKFALDGFSKNLREELKPYNIKVTTVFPGATYTDAWRNSAVDPARIMEAKDVANMVYAATQLSSKACVEDIVLRPQLGDL